MNESISGKWINTQTGETINVSNSIIDGDQMIIMTDKGTIDMDTFSKCYIQSDDSIVEEIKSENNQSLQSSLKGIEGLDESVFVQNNPNQQNPIININETTTTSQEINNYDVINKIFSKINTEPEIDLNIKWEELPIEQIKTFIEFFDLNIDDIAKYIEEKYFSRFIIVLKIQEFLSKMIDK